MSRPAIKSRRDRKPFMIERHQGTYTSLGYRSYRVARDEGRYYRPEPANALDENQRLGTIGQSRTFMRDNGIYKGMIDRMVSYIAGNGYELQITGVRPGIASKIEALWRDWFAKPGIRGLLSGAEHSEMVLREVIVAGDTAILKTDKGVVQQFESEQIAGKKPWYDKGVKVDRYGRPTNFQLCPWHSSGSSVNVNKGTKVKADSVLFITNIERPSQLRGVPACQASFPMLHRINDVCDSEAIAWQLLSRMAVAIIRKDAAAKGKIASKADPKGETEGALTNRLTELNYALIFHGEPGEDVKGIERNIPGSTFSESLRMFLRLVGLPLGMPLELVLLDWSKANYSQSRAVLEQAFKMFTRWQKKMIVGYYNELFCWKLSHWQGQGIVGRVPNLIAGWIPPTFPWIDQLKEAQAHGAKVERGFTTHSMVCKSLNTDRGDIVEQRQKEIRDAIERADKIKEDTGTDVPWQILCGLEDPGKAVAAGKPDDNKEQEDKDDEQDVS